MSINRRQLLASSAAISAISASASSAAQHQDISRHGPALSFDNSRTAHPGATGFDIEDRLAIINLCNSYSSGYDADDFDRWLALFTSEPVCTIHRAGGEPTRLEGDEFRHAFNEFRADATKRNVQPLHYSSNLMIKEQTKDTAIAEMYMFYIPFDINAQDEQGIHGGALDLTGTARYRFKLVKAEDVWLIAGYSISFDQKTV